MGAKFIKFKHDAKKHWRKCGIVYSASIFCTTACLTTYVAAFDANPDNVKQWVSDVSVKHEKAREQRMLAKKERASAEEETKRLEIKAAADLKAKELALVEKQMQEYKKTLMEVGMVTDKKGNNVSNKKFDRRDLVKGKLQFTPINNGVQITEHNAKYLFSRIGENNSTVSDFGMFVTVKKEVAKPEVYVRKGSSGMYPLHHYGFDKNRRYVSYQDRLDRERAKRVAKISGNISNELQYGVLSSIRDKWNGGHRESTAVRAPNPRY